MKKIFVLFLCFVAIVLSGCVATNEPNSEANTTSKKNLATTSTKITTTANTTTTNTSISTKSQQETTKKVTKTTVWDDSYDITETFRFDIGGVLNVQNEEDFINLCKKIKSREHLAKILGCKSSEIENKYNFDEKTFKMILEEKYFYTLKGYDVKDYRVRSDGIAFAFDTGKYVMISTYKRDIRFQKPVFTSSKYGQVYYGSEDYFFKHDGYLVMLHGYKKQKNAENVINNIEFEKHYID